MRHETSVDPGDVYGVLLDRDQRQNLIHERLAPWAARLIRQFHADEQLGHGDRGDRYIVGIPDHRVNGGLAPLRRDQYAGVQDQASGHVLLISSSTASRAAATSASKSASSVPAALARKALTIRPGAVGAGPITAIRLPPRVTTIVSPLSASSRTTAKLRDASVAVITFMKSDYLIFDGDSLVVLTDPQASGSQTNGARDFFRIRKVAGLGDMRFHDLRHTCVTLLLNLGVPPQVVRDIVGHSDIEVTMTIYAHVSLDDKRNALKRLGDALTQTRSILGRLGYSRSILLLYSW